MEAVKAPPHRGCTKSTAGPRRGQAIAVPDAAPEAVVQGSHLVRCPRGLSLVDRACRPPSTSSRCAAARGGPRAQPQSTEVLWGEVGRLLSRQDSEEGPPGRKEL